MVNRKILGVYAFIDNTCLYFTVLACVVYVVCSHILGFFSP